MDPLSVVAGFLATLLLMGLPTCLPKTQAPPAPHAEAVKTSRSLARVPRAHAVLVPSGTFVMGVGPTDYGVLGAGDQHPVTLTRDIWVQTTEVTQAHWFALMGNKPSHGDDCADCPVNEVNWYETLAFANALSRRDGWPEAYRLTDCVGRMGEGMTCAGVTLTGESVYTTRGWRLPTEAEWEYACRAGTDTPWFWGHNRHLAPLFAGFLDEVATRRPNNWGLFDMAGNVQEWCWDGPADPTSDSQAESTEDDTGLGDLLRSLRQRLKAPQPTRAEPPRLVQDPVGDISGEERVVRGGHVLDDPFALLSGVRELSKKADRQPWKGFRLVRTRS